MTINATRIDSLKSRLTVALASDTRRRSAGKTSETKDRARAMAADIKAQAARDALDANDKAMEDSYRARFGRLNAISAKLSELHKIQGAIEVELGLAVSGEDLPDKYTERRAELATRRAALVTAMDASEHPRADEWRDANRYVIELKREQGKLFGQAIHPAYDLADNSRFMQSARYHGRSVGMVSADFGDVVSEAIAYCYMDASADRAAGIDPTSTTIVRSSRVNGKRVEGDIELPTIGGMYRNIKRAHRDFIAMFRQGIKQGKVAEYSLEDMAARGIEVGEYAARRGYVMVDPADIVEESMMAVGELVTDERIAFARELAREERERQARSQARTAATESAGITEVDKTLIELLIEGVTIGEIAKEMGVTDAAITSRLLALPVSASGLYAFRNTGAAEELAWVS
jgi:DNA-binding NarL/FixJ family response regulator